MDGNEPSEAAKRLRDALQGRRRADDSAARERRLLDEERARYEQEKRDVVEETRQVVEAALKALRDRPMERIQVEAEPRGFLARKMSPAKEVEGWKVTLDVGMVQVLCPDGTLIFPPSKGRIEKRHLSSLTRWIDKKVAEAGAPSHIEYGPTRFQEAFDPDTPPEYQDRADAQHALRSRLRRARDEVIQVLARILHERGASI